MEDVVPKWLIKQQSLASEGADLPSGQLFGYTKRKVPCCWDCNQFMSKNLEKPISDAFREGYDAVAQLSPLLLLLWLGKLMYGTRYRETGLRVDVRDPSAPAMLSTEQLLGRLKYLRLALLTAPQELTLGAPLGSLFVYKAGVPDLEQARFDFYVPVFPGSEFIALRVNDVFLMCAFGDNGYWTAGLGGTKLAQACHDLVLHPKQCVEMMLWFSTTIAAYDTFGCYDAVALGGDLRLPGAGRRLLLPQFRLERNELPEGWLNRLRVGTFFERIGNEPQPGVLDAAEQLQSTPTCLIDVPSDELVQAQCFEHDCPDLYNRASWWGVGSTCSRCGISPRATSSQQSS